MVWEIFTSSKLGLGVEWSVFDTTFAGCAKPWLIWLGNGASGGTCPSDCKNCDSVSEASWVFSSKGSKGGGVGSCVGWPSDGDSSVVIVGTSVIDCRLCCATSAKGSVALGAKMESKKLCPSTSPLAVVFVENKSLRVRFGLSEVTP